MESVSPPSHWKEEESDYSNPEFTQPDCLASARLCQPEAEAQADGDKDYVLKGRNAFIRVVPRAESTLDGDDNCYLVTYVHGEREITIWESYMFDSPDQWKEDMRIRNRAINEGLGFSGKFVYRHMDGSEFEADAELPHRSRVLIVPTPDPEHVQPECSGPARLDQPGATAQVRDGKDAHQDGNTGTPIHTPTPDPEPVQPDCLAPVRLDQPGATAQVCDGKDAHRDADAKDLRGKSVSCTAVERLHSEVETLKKSTPDTLRAIIMFEKQSVQMFFSPENALEDFRRKVKELWNIPRKR
jgi:hypothetical protein